MSAFMKSLTSTLLLAIVLLLPSDNAHALLPTHECGYCHSLHGSDTGFVPRSDPVNIEVLCMGCHLTANGTTAAVQPHRGEGSYPEHYSTCTDCHEVHDNMPNWRLNDPNHVADDNAAGRDGTDTRPGGWPVGVNTKMVGREDPDGETPYAIIITKERDMNKDGIPDRNTTVTQTCDDTVENDCYVTRKRHVIFENRDASDSNVTIHGWADHDEDGMSPADATWETITEWGDTAGGGHDAICHMCHTVASKNACGYDGAADCSLHNQDRTCTDCHLHDGCFDKGADCTPWTMPNRDVRMDSVVAAPISVNSGQTVTITANFTNLGDATEVVRVKFYSSIDRLLGIVDVADVPPAGGTGQAVFDWTTTTDGSHTVSAEAQPVIAEVNVANNTLTGNTVTVALLDIHDVTVTAVTAPPQVEVNTSATVSVDIANQGGYSETFNVTLVSDLDGTIQTLSSGALGIGATATLNFTWDTTGATEAVHTLTATADTVPGETDTADNSASTTSEVVPPAQNDVTVGSVTAPASVTQGTSAGVDVQVTNNGLVTETFNVTLVSDLDGTIQTLSSGALAAGNTTTLNFTWNTTASTTVGTHTLTATADTVPGETNTADNSASTTVDVVAEGPVNDLAIIAMSINPPSPIATCGTRLRDTLITVTVENQGTVTESNFSVVLASDHPDDQNFDPQTVTSLASGATTDVIYNWTFDRNDGCGLRTFTATADTVTGETDTADNTRTLDVDIVN